MKRKILGLVISLSLCSLVSYGQDTPTPSAAPTPAVVPAEGPALGPPGTPAAPAAAPAVATPATGAAVTSAVAGANDIIPLIQIEDVPLTDAIRNLARQSSLNFQFDPRVTVSNQPNISIRFENVTAGEALNAVLDNYNLVLAKDTRSKIARVTVKDPKAEDPLVSKIVQLKYSDPTNMVAMLKPVLSARSQVLPDPRTSQLVVTTTEKEVDAVLALVARLDTPTKQVLIESQIFETTRNPSTIKGIDWSGTLQNHTFSMGNNLQINPDPGTSKPVLAGTSSSPQYQPKISASTIGKFMPGFLNSDGISAVLSFLNTDSESEVLATPRAVTLDNQTAVLSVTRAYPIFLITPGSANTAAGSSINYTNLGTILHVTPRVAADNNVALTVVPEVSNVDGTDKQVVNGLPNEANVYAIRRIETHVMIPSGTTLVMGGLINDTKNKGYTKVPLLGDLPGLGAAFRKESTDRKKSNLLIFMTPTILDEAAFMASTTAQDFLKSKVTQRPEGEMSAWDSAKPHDWTKPVY